MRIFFPAILPLFTLQLLAQTEIVRKNLTAPKDMSGNYSTRLKFINRMLTAVIFNDLPICTDTMLKQLFPQKAIKIIFTSTRDGRPRTLYDEFRWHKPNAINI